MTATPTPPPQFVWQNFPAQLETPEDSPFTVEVEVLNEAAGTEVVFAIDRGLSTCDDGEWQPALDIDPTTGTVTGTPTNGDVGDCVVTLTATNGTAQLSGTFVVKVTPVNDPPYWVTVPSNRDVQERQSVLFQAAARDDDAGETPLYSLDGPGTTCGQGGTFIPPLQMDSVSGIITGTPTELALGTCSIKINAISGPDTITAEFQINVMNVNERPVWVAPLPDLTHPEDLPLAVIPRAKDPDPGQTPSYFLDLANMTCDDGSFNPPLNINTQSGIITGTPTNGDVGLCTIRVGATSGVDTIYDGFVLTVTNTNDLPRWAVTIADFNHPENVAMTVTVRAVDDDPGQTPTYGLDLAAMTCDNGTWSPGISIDAVSGTIRGTPRTGDIGSCTIKALATSGNDTISQEFTVMVRNEADLPRWITVPNNFAHPEDQPLAGRQVKAQDDDPGETPVYSLDKASMTCDDGTWNPPLAIDPGTGILSGTPPNHDVGDCTVRVASTSGGDTIYGQFTISVTNVNQLPTWVTTIPDSSHPEDLPFLVTARAKDIDQGENPVYSIDRSASTCDDGAWNPPLAIDAVSGAITGTPHNADVGTCSIRVVATSGADKIFDDFILTITNVNDPPTWIRLIGNFPQNEDLALSGVKAEATDEDAGQTPIYSLDPNNMTCDDGSWSANISINPTTGVLSGTPRNDDVGTCTVRIIAMSGLDTITQQFVISVINVNDLPTWNQTIADQSIHEDVPFSVMAKATDVDAFDTPTYSLDYPNMTCDDGSWMPNLTINATNGVITGTPTNNDIGTCSVKFVAHSGADTITDVFNITVNNVKDLPTWYTLIQNFNQPEETPITGKLVSAIDVDAGESPVYSLDPTGMSCDNGSWMVPLAVDGVSGILSGTPSHDDLSSCTVKILATSGIDTISTTFTITVTPVNHSPVWVRTISDFTHPTYSPVAVTLKATDIDAGQVPEYSLDFGNMTCDDGAWSPTIKIDGQTGVISGTPTNSDVGSCTVRVAARTGADVIYDDFMITVIHTLETVTQTFPAADLSADASIFNLTDPYVEQSITMAYSLSAEESSFTQITRPNRTDVFTQGYSGTAVTESFSQNELGLLDILMVVDNSASMLDNQENLSTKLSALLAYIGNSDWQIGVVTTDVSDGCLSGLVKKSDPDPMAAFENAVKVGNGGANNEIGIQTAVVGLKQNCLIRRICG